LKPLTGIEASVWFELVLNSLGGLGTEAAVVMGTARAEYAKVFGSVVASLAARGDGIR
jgi:hypothetical protein